MTYDLCKFERGQVWMVRFKQQEAVGHEQSKDRPYLVLSVGKFNKSSGMLTAVPITTRDYLATPAQVKFTNDRGVNNVILCEQVRSFDHSSGAYIFDFMGNVSDEILEKVDVAISIHLGLHYSPITLNKLYDSMEAIIKSIGYMQEKVSTPKFTDDDVLHFAEKLQMLASTSETPHYRDIIKDMDEAYNIPHDDADFDKDITTTMKPYYINLKDDEEDTTVVHTIEYEGPSIPDQDNNVSVKVEVKKKRIKWTPETCKEFINDANTLPMKRVMEKWDISKKTRFYSMKNYAVSLLEKTK